MIGRTLGRSVTQWLLAGTLMSWSIFAVRAEVQLGQLQVSAIGHVFSPPAPYGPPLIQPQVTDYLVDQKQISHGGATTPAITANFDTDHRFVLTIRAPAGQKFWVHVPPGQSVRLAGLLDWQGPDVLSNGPSEYGTATVSFGNLEGAAPGYFTRRAVLSQLHGFFGFNDIQSLAFTNDIAFTSITLTATVPNSGTGAGALSYAPSGDNSLVFFYHTTQTSDPGPFVSLVPAGRSAGGKLLSFGAATAGR